jgi:hypothetical protein
MIRERDNWACFTCGTTVNPSSVIEQPIHKPEVPSPPYLQSINYVGTGERFLPSLGTATGVLDVILDVTFIDSGKR